MNNLLNRKVLVLNSSYEPLMVISARRAILLVLTDKVDIIVNYSEFINSTYSRFHLPSVILLKKYIKYHKSQITLSRKNLLKRDNRVCQYCGKTDTKMTIDHIIPKVKGGTDTWENLVTACFKCNSKKGNKLLSEITMQLIKKPRKPSMITYLQNYVTLSQNEWKPYLYMTN